MTRARDLAEVIADWRGDAAVLRRRGNAAAAEMLEQCADQAARAAEEWLLWLTEGEATLRSGHAVAWLRARFEDWRRAGHARQTGRHTRIYRACIIPRRVNVVSAAERGRDAARRAMESAA